MTRWYCPHSNFTVCASCAPFMLPAPSTEPTLTATIEVAV